MAGTWSLRVGPEVHSGLTLFRLENLVRSGTLQGHHLVCSDGKWMRVDEVPYLRRHLKAPGEKEQKARSNVIPLPIAADAALAMLAASSDRVQADRWRRIGQIVSILATAVLALEAFVLVWAMLHHTH